MYQEPELHTLHDLARAGVPLDPAQTIRLIAQVRMALKVERRMETLARHVALAIGADEAAAVRDPESLLPRLAHLARERRPAA
jgi:hypothetical protein